MYNDFIHREISRTFIDGVLRQARLWRLPPAQRVHLFKHQVTMLAVKRLNLGFGCSTMKATVATLFFSSFLLAATAFAQNASAGTAVAPGCGTVDIKFDVKTDKSQHPAAQSGPAKAAIYLVEDDTQFQSRPLPVTRIGLDGTWVGANHGNSYFYLTVGPGEHHLGANWQSFVGFGPHHQSAAAHFTAEAGRSYYFTVKNTWLREAMIMKMALEPLDSDEGQLLASRFAFSISR